MRLLIPSPAFNFRVTVLLICLFAALLILIAYVPNSLHDNKQVSGSTNSRFKAKDKSLHDEYISRLSEGLQMLSVSTQTRVTDRKHENDFIWNQVDGKFKHRLMATNCRMSNCFNWTRCQLNQSDVLKIHIYPDVEDFDLKGHNHNIFKTSVTYAKILSVIESSVHYERDPYKACLFVPLFDTLSRDVLSPDFVKHLAYHFVPIDEGRNHLMFNLYSGTWPDYHELDFAGFNPGYSILVKASSSPRNFRPGFDISLPLFDKSHPEKSLLPVQEGFAEFAELDQGSAAAGRRRQQEQQRFRHKLPNGDVNEENEDEEESLRRIFDQEPEKTFPVVGGRGLASSSSWSHAESSADSKALLVFKGKRYTYGIGSETRNCLHHLHNGRDVLIYTTCKHGKKWKEVRDERCEHDNAVYDSIDYQTLMENSTFCLIPRGRRLGSYRFLEALSVGCIPVLLSNDWVKPFHEIIDWNQVVVDGDERQLFQLVEVLRSFDQQTIQRMRTLSLAVYETYFSSVQQIVLTTIDILTDRIRSHSAKSSDYWNLLKTGICDHSSPDSDADVDNNHLMNQIENKVPASS